MISYCIYHAVQGRGEKSRLCEPGSVLRALGGRTKKSEDMKWDGNQMGLYCVMYNISVVSKYFSNYVRRSHVLSPVFPSVLLAVRDSQEGAVSGQHR